MKTRPFNIALFGILFFVFVAQEATAQCRTERIDVAVNLDATSPTTSFPFLAESFDALDSAASYKVNLSIEDSQRQVRLLILYFFKTEENVWTAAVYADGSELRNAPDGPVLGGNLELRFLDSERTNVPFPPTPDMAAVLLWDGGAFSDPLNVYLDRARVIEQPSSLAGISKNDCSSRHPQSAGLDFDGDRRDDIAIWRPSLGLWAIRTSVFSGQVVFRQWGLPGDVPMPGDYTGDGVSDLVVWRPAEGNWYLCSSESAFSCDTGTVTQFGLPGDRPMRADYDGDGILDFSIWRPSSGEFYYRTSAGEEVCVQQWGLPGDIPLVPGVAD
ncbi:hypothetical protein [Botrimarina sp.]|uniref:hypothetical protein n=1 Tax=Botrimarina sp. TaxID=2795802 RepID=UPI0032ECA39E